MIMRLEEKGGRYIKVHRLQITFYQNIKWASFLSFHVWLIHPDKGSWYMMIVVGNKIRLNIQCPYVCWQFLAPTVKTLSAESVPWSQLRVILTVLHENAIFLYTVEVPLTQRGTHQFSLFQVENGSEKEELFESLYTENSDPQIYFSTRQKTGIKFLGNLNLRTVG